MKLPQDFLQLSQQVGSNPLLVQGPGGNTSVKIDGDIHFVMEDDDAFCRFRAWLNDQRQSGRRFDLKWEMENGQRTWFEFEAIFLKEMGHDIGAFIQSIKARNNLK